MHERIGRSTTIAVEERGKNGYFPGNNQKILWDCFAWLSLPQSLQSNLTILSAFIVVERRGQ